MALLDRVKERTGTTLSDGELTAMLEGLAAELDARLGALAETEEYFGDAGETERSRQVLTLMRPLDPGESVAVVEYAPGNSGDATAQTVLDASDYRVLHGGRTLQRLTGGPNGHMLWAPLVRVTYTPKGDQAARDEVTIKLVALDLSYRGLIKSETAGDYSWAGSVASDSYTAERDRLIGSLATRSGLVLA
jgi:hypothetical protein